MSRIVPVLAVVTALLGAPSVPDVRAQPPSPSPLTRHRVDAITTLTDTTLWAERARIAAFALERRIATTHELRGYSASGALMSYGAIGRDIWEGIAGDVDKILRGARPADLPVQQPTRPRLVINLKTAAALGLTIPPAVLQRADEVIQ